MTFGRLLRTTLALSARQIGGQLVQPARGRVIPPLLTKRLVPLPNVIAPPRVEARTLPALATHAERERARAVARMPFLTGKLLEFEETYGLECGADGGGPPDRWHSPTAFTPFCASVRARRLAVALLLGADPRLFDDLLRAAQAVLLQLEVHLLGNHYLENALGLLSAGALTGGPTGLTFRKVGFSILERELAKQFRRDGAHAERSISYHLHLLAALLEVRALLNSSGHSVPKIVDETIARGLSYALVVRAPDGSYPLFNDASLDAAPSIDEVLTLARGLGENVVAPRREPFHSPRDGGLATMEMGDFFLAFDVGEDGFREQPGHVHADALTFELWHRGRRAIVDYGVGSYAVDDERSRTRSTRVHNTLELEGADSAEVWSAFRTGRFAGARVVAATIRPTEIALTAAHDGFSHLIGAPRHVRTLTLSEKELRVKDRFTGRPREAVSRLRLAREVDLRVVGAGERIVRSDSVYFPRFRDPLPAHVYEQRWRPGDDKILEWRVFAPGT